MPSIYLFIIISMLIVFGTLMAYINYLRKRILKSEQKLQNQHEWFRVTLSGIADAVIVTDEKGCILFMNRMAEELTGCLESEFFRKPVTQVMHIVSENTGTAVEISINRVLAGETAAGMEENLKLVSTSGHEYSIINSMAPIRNEKGEAFGVVITIQDITRQKSTEKKYIESYKELEATQLELASAEEELKSQFYEFMVSKEALWKSEERYRLAVEGSSDGLWDWDAHTGRMFLSPRCKEMLEFNEEPEHFFEAWLLRVHPEDAARVVKVIKDHLAQKNPYLQFEYRLKSKAGGYKWFLCRGQAIWDSENKPIRMAGSHTNITDRKTSEEKIHHLAYYDLVTELPNRTLLLEKLDAALVQAQQNKHMVGLLFLDLDNFKTINDTLGHVSGDQLLRGVGEILKKLVREGDTVARLSGDEFTVLLPQITEVTKATEMAEMILCMLQKPWMLDTHEFHITGSIGIALYPDDGPDGFTMLKNADTAMYYAKSSGKNNYRLYTRKMNETMLERVKIENDLRYAVEREEFVLYYQPQVDMKNGRILGAEALVRWIHPVKGLVPPGDFIPISEETGLIVFIGRWVLQTACEQAQKWHRAGYPPVRISVNLSARQFQQQDLVESIMQVLNETGLDPRLLELEITESIAIIDMEYTVTVLNRLKDMGVSVSMDDFGTGYSSLNYLKQLPIDVLKIDKSFVGDITTNSNQEAIAKAVISLAHALNLTVVAEGVETMEQLDFLKEYRCDRAQGYLFSKPLTEKDFEKLLIEKNLTVNREGGHEISR